MESTTCWTLECKIGLLSSSKIFSDANFSTLLKSFNENVSEILEFSFQLTPVFLF